VTCVKEPQLVSWRVIVVSEDRSNVLLSTGPSGFVLPAVDLPQLQRVAENLGTAMKNDWGCEVLCLFALEPAQPAHAGHGDYLVAEYLRPSSRPEARTIGTGWLAIGSLSADRFKDIDDYRAIRDCLLRRHGKQRSGDQETEAAPFVKPGWFRELRNWAGEVIRPRGLELTGGFTQFTGSPAFSLIRLATSGPAVWFKAVGQPNRREFGITIQLAQQFPKYIAQVLGTRPDWNGWLSSEAEGVNLSETHELPCWETAASELASLQVDSIGRVANLQSLGARDLGISAISDMVRPFLAVANQFAERFSDGPEQLCPPELRGDALLNLGEQIGEAMARLRQLQLPETIGHLDLNPGNIVVSTAGSRFLDWAEAYTGNPFLSFEYLRQHGRRAFPNHPSAEQKLEASYSAVWKQVISAETVAKALQLAPLLAVFAYAAGNTWTQPDKRGGPDNAAYLRSLTARMHREAKRFTEEELREEAKR
jgi:hypothetical protein